MQELSVQRHFPIYSILSKYPKLSLSPELFKPNVSDVPERSGHVERMTIVDVSNFPGESDLSADCSRASSTL